MLLSLTHAHLALVVLVMAVLIGSVTSTVGILLYVCCGIARVPVSQASKIIWPFVLMMVLVLFLCVLFHLW